MCMFTAMPFLVSWLSNRGLDILAVKLAESFFAAHSIDLNMSPSHHQTLLKFLCSMFDIHGHVVSDRLSSLSCLAVYLWHRSSPSNYIHESQYMIAHSVVPYIPLLPGQDSFWQKVGYMLNYRWSLLYIEYLPLQLPDAQKRRSR